MKTALRYSCAAIALLLNSAAFAAYDTSCQLENGRTLALSELDTTPRYQYGSKGSTELALTASSRNPVYKGSVMFSGGGASYVRFVNGPYSYVAYNGIGRGWEFTGLAVYKGDQLIMHKACRPSKSTSLSLDHAKIAAPDDPHIDLFGAPPL